MHIGGPPQPHRSWREFVLVTMVSALLIGGFIRLVRKCCILRIFKHVQEKLREQNLGVLTISKQVEGLKEKDTCTMDHGRSKELYRAAIEQAEPPIGTFRS